MSQKAKDFASARLKSTKAWSEFFDKSKYTWPPAKEVVTRLKDNVMYFQTNYVILFLVLCTYCVLTNPLFLLSFVAIIGMWTYALSYRSSPFTIGRFVISDNTRNCVLGAVTLGVFYYSSVGSTLFWLIGATLTFVLVHALAFTRVDDELNFGNL